MELELTLMCQLMMLELTLMCLLMMLVLTLLCQLMVLVLILLGQFGEPKLFQCYQLTFLYQVPRH